ncbi:MAG: aspartate dehydrogenase [Hominisplanchenecus sp.]
MSMRRLFRKKQEKKTYDRENQQPVLHCSICTGETAAGFKDMRTGKFEEVMLIRKDEDLKQFMEMYGIDSIRKEY